MLATRKTADLVVVLKTLPTKTAVEALGKKCQEDLAKDGMKRKLSPTIYFVFVISVVFQ